MNQSSMILSITIVSIVFVIINITANDYGGV